MYHGYLLPNIEPPFPERGDREANKAPLEPNGTAVGRPQSAARPARSTRSTRPPHQLGLRGAMGARWVRTLRLLGLVLLWSRAGMTEAFLATATPPAPAQGKEGAAEGLWELRAARSSPRGYRAPFGSALRRGGCLRLHVLLRRRWGGTAPRH